MWKLKPGQKLLASVSLLLLIVALAAFSLWHMVKARSFEAYAQQHAEAASLADTLAQQIEYGHSQALAYVMVSEDSARSFYQAGLEELAVSNAQLRSRIEPLSTEPKAFALYQYLQQARLPYVAWREAALESLTTNQAYAKRLISSIDINTLVQDYIDSIETLAQYHHRQAATMGIQAAATSQFSLYGLIINSLLALALATAITWRHIRLVDIRHRPVRRRHPPPAIGGPTRPDADSSQRRAHFRVRTPLINAASFAVLDPSVDVFNCVFPLFDISTGGARLIDLKGRLNNHTDKIFHGRLDLPGAQSVQLDLKILRVNETQLDGQKILLTAAGKFHEQDHQQHVAIQQYIDLLDRKLNQNQKKELPDRPGKT